MLRRNLKHQLRYPSLTPVRCRHPDCVPAAVRLRFRWQLGDRPRRTGVRRPAARTSPMSSPASLIITVASAALGTAISVAIDMTGGIIDRFRTMAISRGAVLTGHVIGSLIQTLAVLAIVLGVALPDRLPTRTPAALEWLAAAGPARAVRVRAHLAVRRAGMARRRAWRPPATPPCSSPCCRS